MNITLCTTNKQITGFNFILLLSLIFYTMKPSSGPHVGHIHIGLWVKWVNKCDPLTTLVCDGNLVSIIHVGYQQELFCDPECTLHKTLGMITTLSKGSSSKLFNYDRTVQ